MNHNDLLESVALAKRNMATEILGTLRRIRDECPDEWDKIVHTEGVGPDVVELFDYLKHWEK